MKTYSNILLFIFLSVLISCKQEKSENTKQGPETAVVETKMNDTEALQGAWTASYINKDGAEITFTTIVVNGYLAETLYNKDTKTFERTFGGSWYVEGGVFFLKEEFSSSDSSGIGKTRKIVYELDGDTIAFAGDDKIWTRIDNSQSDLKGAWLISGRERDGKISEIKTGPRKTMKILSGTRFQWIAYNTETGDFRGTGGGTYTAENGEYVENIEFFSRDSSRVGASLSFKYEIKNNDWHHSGLSSKGDPIYEIWSHRDTQVDTN